MVKVLIERGSNIDSKSKVSYNTVIYIYTILYYMYIL